MQAKLVMSRGKSEEVKKISHSLIAQSSLIGAKVLMEKVLLFLLSRLFPASPPPFLTPEVCPPLPDRQPQPLSSNLVR